MRRALVLVVLLPLAGCLDPGEFGATPGAGANDDRAWTLLGTFTRERTQADLDRWCDVARAYGNDCVLMESYPEQYRLGFAREADCRAARDELLLIPNVRPGECERAPDPVTDPETPTSSEPAEAEFPLDVVRLTWTDGDPSDPHAMEWDVVEASLSDGLLTIQMTTYGIEGGDFRATFFLRPGEVPARLAHAGGAPEAGTFDLKYDEKVFWRGRPVDTIVSVDRASFVQVDAMDPASDRLSGSFRIDFMGRCTSAFNCTDEYKLQRTVLDGSFST